MRVLVTPCSEDQCVCNRITFLEGNTVRWHLDREVGRGREEGGRELFGYSF